MQCFEFCRMCEKKGRQVAGSLENVEKSLIPKRNGLLNNISGFSPRTLRRLHVANDQYGESMNVLFV